MFGSKEGEEMFSERVSYICVFLEVLVLVVASLFCCGHLEWCAENAVVGRQTCVPWWDRVRFCCYDCGVPVPHGWRHYTKESVEVVASISL